MPDACILILGLPAFVAFWVLVTRLLGSFAGLSKIDVTPLDEALRKSPYGSANLNGVAFNGNIQLIEYRSGLLLRLMAIMGGGAIWLPHNTFYVDEPEGLRFFLGYARITSTVSDTRIRLGQRLARFLKESKSIGWAPPNAERLGRFRHHPNRKPY